MICIDADRVVISCGEMLGGVRNAVLDLSIRDEKLGRSEYVSDERAFEFGSKGVAKGR